MKKDIAMQPGEESEINSIKRLRLATGMSQGKLAEILNMPRGTWRNWEQGLRVPPDYIIELIEYKLRGEGLIPPKH